MRTNVKLCSWWASAEHVNSHCIKGWDYTYSYRYRAWCCRYINPTIMDKRIGNEHEPLEFQCKECFYAMINYVTGRGSVNWP